MIGIYIHIPFCRRLCPYCDFVRQPIAAEVPETYVRALCREIAEFDGSDQADSVFFGGGTPSLMGAGALNTIMSALRRRSALTDAEITLEANPDDVTPVLLDAWLANGVNRVSLGVQSFDDATLRYLGRRHDAVTARRACDLVAARCDNWSMDLIFGAPPIDAFSASLSECATRFRPSHVSTYGLTFELDTPFAERAADAVDDDTYIRLYREADAILVGCERYEISNFAVPGRQCRHNLRYWHNLEYAGFGQGAYSYIGNCRARNHVALDDYVAHPGEKAEALHLSDAEVRVETLIQRFRLRAGLDKRDYAARFGRSLRDDYGGILDDLIARGLLEEDVATIRPTRKGFDLNNEIGLALVGRQE